MLENSGIQHFADENSMGRWDGAPGCLWNGAQNANARLSGEAQVTRPQQTSYGEMISPPHWIAG